MSKEKQIEEMALDICKSRLVAEDGDACRKCRQHNNCLYQEIAYGLYNAGYRKQSEGEWEFATNHFFNDYGDLKVYATASCSECKKAYPFNPTVAGEFVERPETLSAYEDWDIDVEPIKAEVLKQAKANKSLYPFCPNCGAKMKGESNEQGKID